MSSTIEIMQDTVVPEVDTAIVFGSEPTLIEQVDDVPVYIHTCSYCGTQKINSKISNKSDYMCVTCDANNIEVIYKGDHDTFVDSLCLQALFLSKRMRCKNRDA